FGSRHERAVVIHANSLIIWPRGAAALSIYGMTHDSGPNVAKPKLAYTLEEDAEATGYSSRTLRIAIRRHDLLARYANTKAIILADELQDWLKSLPTEP